LRPVLVIGAPETHDIAYANAVSAALIATRLLETCLLWSFSRLPADVRQQDEIERFVCGDPPGIIFFAVCG